MRFSCLLMCGIINHFKLCTLCKFCATWNTSCKVKFEDLIAARGSRFCKAGKVIWCFCWKPWRYMFLSRMTVAAGSWHLMKYKYRNYGYSVLKYLNGYFVLRGEGEIGLETFSFISLPGLSMMKNGVFQFSMMIESYLFFSQALAEHTWLNSQCR